MRVAWLGFALLGCGRIGFDNRFEPGADARTAVISGCAVPVTGAVACYPFDGSAADGVRQNNATTTAVTYDVGRVGDGVRLDASSLVTAAGTSANRLATTGTVAAWIRLDVLPAAGARSIVVDTNGYGLAVLSTGDVECFYTGVHHTFASALVVGTWSQVACAYDGSAVTAWKDGSLIESQPDSGPVVTASSLQLGSNIPDSGHPGPDRLLGMLDEVGIWNVALTTADVCATAGTC